MEDFADDACVLLLELPHDARVIAVQSAQKAANARLLVVDNANLAILFS
ncbi:hypothetical protein HMPREF1580_01011 [Gardnerella vaginalis JCP8070]|nr:hypothetical protein HMPREF1586_00170 [Gardnerella vaginalis JCP8522]EPI59083.1 hypothetical protein HMPREF1580_01011 [Gardnerella vaginalis JCP8070]